MTATPMIELQSIGKTFNQFVALKPTSLAIEQGEFLTLLGPSGSGKSTLLNLISGAYSSSSGKILLKGKDITSAPPRDREIGMVFQNYALMPHLSAFDNVAYPLRVRGVAKAQIHTRVMDALKRVGLAGFEQRKPKQLSGGQQQRVGIARCIVYSPSIILMDEPLGALDKNMREQMQDEIKTLHREIGTTFIYVTHDQEEALNMSDRICLMNEGGIVQLGTPDDLYFRPVNAFAARFIGESNLLAGSALSATEVRLKNGQVYSVAGHPALVPGQAYELLLRPERVRIVAPGQGGAMARGTVAGVAFIGSLTTLTVNLPDGSALKLKTTSLPSQNRPQPGEAIDLCWAPEDFIVLGAEPPATPRHLAAPDAVGYSSVISRA
ncbi:ATP-binding cassette domain-containing protein [Pseudomonas sp. NPDC007930]|uniref:ABC transporter ATP-binding protein n=1 Tax=Pseudomonas sp. NPDC007930 TaxID=3364417 RepID=UPI0036E354F0